MRAAGRRNRAQKGSEPFFGSEKPEPAISRVLSRAIIHLGRPSPAASSNLPGNPLGTGGATEAAHSPIWSCSGRGLPCRGLLPAARCALTAPFHPYRACARRYIFCGTFHGLAPPRRYLAPCPKEPGLSSAPHWNSDCLADSGVSGPRILMHLPPSRARGSK